MTAPVQRSRPGLPSPANNWYSRRSRRVVVPQARGSRLCLKVALGLGLVVHGVDGPHLRRKRRVWRAHILPTIAHQNG
jgi:hypothetical protein